ncbi:flavin-containing monooxygenase FMO GS-OX-like 3 [Daucus carota subsp. sativus]|uniref:flavin-containing monooxygenase FMO GS-OX-like 3 n=1 Tax=Daucus carota subsp. sativus TaxID=79200 RepID=UPI0030828418
MNFSDYPFAKSYGDPRNFPGHEEVLKFLNEFWVEFGLTELTRLGTEVVRVEAVDDSGYCEWIVESRKGELSEVEVFDGVVICNGHHTVPRVAAIRDIGQWPGKQIHSHNYRVPEPFHNQIVVMTGAGPSAYDISRDIAGVANYTTTKLASDNTSQTTDVGKSCKEVHLSSRNSTCGGFYKLVNLSNVRQHAEIDYVDESGRVAFVDGSSVCADIIFHCTGYMFSFPFLRTNGIVTVDDNRVGPLYKHVFSPEIGSRLSFVGIPCNITLFPMMELQSKWISCVLSSKVVLPSKEAMLADTNEHYRSLEERGIPKHSTHSLATTAFQYLDWLASQVKVQPVEERLKNIYKQLVSVFFSSEGDQIREWDVDSWVNGNHLKLLAASEKHSASKLLAAFEENVGHDNSKVVESS